MDLYTFGFNGHAQLHPLDITSSKENLLVPKLVLQGLSIHVLWSSWCDGLSTHATYCFDHKVAI